MATEAVSPVVYRIKEPIFIGLAVFDAIFLFPLIYGDFKVTEFLKNGVVTYFILTLFAELFRKIRPVLSRKFEFMATAAKMVVLFYFFAVYVKDPTNVTKDYAPDNSGLGIFNYRGVSRVFSFLYSLTIIDAVWLITTVCQIVVVGTN